MHHVRSRSAFRWLRPAVLATAIGLACTVLAASAQSPSAPAAELFPQPFVVEHSIAMHDGADVFRSPAVTDYYGGQWIVSVRPDGSRLLVDLVRRELTEIRPEKGRWWAVSFDRLAELQRQQAAAVDGPGPVGQPASEPSGEPTDRRTAGSDAPPELVVRDGREVAARSLAPGPLASGLLAASRVRHLAVQRADATAAQPPLLEVWVDPAIRLAPAARAALERFETSLLPVDDPLAAGRLLAVARDHADGALALRTLRPVRAPSGMPSGALIEDLATRAEWLETFPAELLQRPEGLRRVPHPLEAVVAFHRLEAENEGVHTPSPDGRR